MVDVTTKRIIDRPVEEVAAYATDPDHAPQWYENIHRVEWKTSKPLEEGSEIAFSAKFLGKILVYTYRITHYQPGIKLVMRTAEGPFPMETTYTWKEAGAGRTEMGLRNCGEPAGYSRWFSPIMSFMMKQANKKDLKKLQSLLEER